MEEILKIVEGTCKWTQGWLEENSVRLDAIEVSCVLLSLSRLVSAAGIKQESPVPGKKAEEPEERGKTRETVSAAEPEEKYQERKKRKLDAGKIRALQKANWSAKAIAEEMDCSIAAVYKILGNGGAGRDMKNTSTGKQDSNQ